MKKKILYALLGLVIIFVVYVTYTISNPVSPLKTVSFNEDGQNITITYSAPFKNDRLIFGPESESALVPFNKYWRTGANFCTDFYNSSEISFNGGELESGKYFLYTFPNKDSWDVILNSENGRFGFFNPNRENDVLITNVPSYTLNENIEQFTIDFLTENQELYLRLRWEKTGISIPIK